MLALNELTPKQRKRNRQAASDLVEGEWYRFCPPAETIPLERQTKGVPNAGEPITFTRARYLGWREEPEEHMFYAEVEEEFFFAPMFICDGGVTCIPISDEPSAVTTPTTPG